MANQKIPIFIINLLRDVDKKNHIIKILKPLNLSYEFFEAVDGKQLSESAINKIYDSKAAKKENGKDLTVGEIGCSLSHLGIYKQMLAEDIKQAIILEDDAIIEDGFLQVISEINHFPKDWELVLLGYQNHTKYDCKIKQTKINNLPNYCIYCSISTLHGAYGYIINQQGAEKMLAANQKIYAPIDSFTGDYKTLNFYAIYPPVVNVDFSMPSSIDSGDDKRGSNKKIKRIRQLRRKLQNKSRFLGKLSFINRKRKCFFKLVVYFITHKR